MSRTPLMAGNWKMNLDHLQGTHLVQKLDWTLKDGKHDFGAVEVAVMPPFTDLRSVQTLIEVHRLRASSSAGRTFPSTTTVPALRDQRSFPQARLYYVIVGHSERREYHNETDAVVADKLARRTQRAHPDLLLRRRPEVRKAGTHVAHVVAQVGRPAAVTPNSAFLVVAYEPIWAIGTGEVATPDDAQEVCSAIRTKLAEMYSGDTADGIRILYGGSVKSGNIATIMAGADVDGALVGGASLDPSEFAAICRYQQHVTG